MSVIEVLYGRYGGLYTKEFDSLEKAAVWIEVQEDESEIFAAEVRQDGRVLFEYVTPPDDQRWRKVDSSTPDWPGEHP